MRVLIVDDEVDIREFVRYNLAKEGYEIETAENGREAIEKALTFKPHLVLMDMMMPQMNGREACRVMRSTPPLDKAVVIFLSAVCEEDSLIECYEAGADDYITKPVSIRILCSRVNAVMKRITESDNAPLESALLNEKHHSFMGEEGEIYLAIKEYEILRLLLSEPRIFSREEIYDAVWGKGVIVGARTLDVHIRHLRSKIGEERISTCKGIGYQFR